MKRTLIAIVGTVAFVLQREPTPRKLVGTTIRVAAELATVSGARELRDGRLLVSDAKRAAVYLVDPKTGATQQIGSAGADSAQYAQPGGFYAGLGDTTYLLDRGLARILVISPSGAIVGPRSIKQRGISSSNDADLDFQRVDSRGLAYFINRRSLGRPKAGDHSIDSAVLIRFDAARQHGDSVALLRNRERVITQADEHLVFSSEIRGSPADDWGVAPDGRIAVVRASPYRVEWYGTNGRIVRGPTIAIDSLPYTDAEKDSINAASAGSGGAGAPSVGFAGSDRSSSTKPKPLFTPFKPPFEPNDVMVSPDARVWISRTRPMGATATVYDVFDGQGNRIDRVELPARSRVIGFGKAAVYAVERDEKGRPSLRKYSVRD